MAIFTVPTLLDFWITSATVSAPCGCASVMGAPGDRRCDPGLVSMRVSAVHGPRLQRQGGGEGLHGRAGLEGVGTAPGCAALRSALERCGATGS